LFYILRAENFEHHGSNSAGLVLGILALDALIWMKGIYVSYNVAKADMTLDRVKCPQCAELVKKEAKICRYGHSAL
jgi:hypothetical protein